MQQVFCDVSPRPKIWGNLKCGRHSEQPFCQGGGIIAEFQNKRLFNDIFYQNIIQKGPFFDQFLPPYDVIKDIFALMDKLQRVIWYTCQVGTPPVRKGLLSAFIVSLQVE